jgi:hypothetical protein
MAATTTAPPPPYPVHVDAVDRPAVSRWLWLVKWLLAIPHFIVLAFLWVAFAVLSLVALVAILFAGRYPRAIFDFNVGVLRWSWRVGYYSYGALATDQYPPFTLAEVPDYPAHLEVDYPEHLSRGLVLVKWWLLAIPHYIVLSLFLGTGVWVAWQGDDSQLVWGSGLVGILVLVAAVVLAFTGSYPRPVYDLLLGLHRWALRVAAYVGLMTDQYPPFRLDQGPHEPEAGLLMTQAATPPPSGSASAAPQPPAQGIPPQQHGSAPAAPQPPTGAAPQGPPPTTSGWTAGRVIAVVVGCLLILMSFGLLAGGTAVLIADQVARDDGFVTTEVETLSTDDYAYLIDNVLVVAPGPGSEVLDDVVGELRVRATPEDATTPVFVGIARDRDVDAYLAGVARTLATEESWTGRDLPGTAPTTVPEDVPIWEVSSVGTGEQELRWTPQGGRWSLVVMNADASPGVTVTGDVGITLPWLTGAGIVLLVVGVIVLAGGVALLVVGIRRASRPVT